ncbi:hypothetical protein [Neisseria sp. Ec49-e6-T10]|uniref:hypothetical protein n=1 Tax=Neisseria sp. Ec49-e6-T10 TaxID=3140744 RepID=UPI003EBD8883
MHLNLLVPGLAWAKEDQLATLLNQQSLPALNQILRFSNKQQGFDHLSSFYHQFLPQINELDYLIHHHQLSTDQHYILASPVGLRLNRNHIDLADSAVLNVTQQEAQQICADLNDFLIEEQWRFIPVTTDLWLLNTPKALNIKTTSLYDVMGNNIEEYQPKGSDSFIVQKILTEIQMVLFNHSVNQQREQTNLPAINAIWLWQTQQHEQKMPLDSVYFVPKPLWQQQLNCFDTPYDFKTWQNTVTEEKITQTQHYILLEDLLGATQYQDIWGYQDALVQLEQHYLQPAWQALKSGQLASLSLYTHGPFGGHMKIKPHSHWAFWKKKQQFNGRIL